MASIGYLLATIAFGNHDHRASVALEQVDIRIHTPRRRRPKRARCHSFGRLGRSGIINRVIFEILRHLLSCIETFFYFGMGNIPTHYNGSVERQSRGNRIFGQFGKDFVHRAIQIDLYGIPFSGLTQLFGDKSAGIIIEAFYPQTFPIDFGLDIPVGRTRYTQPYGTRRAMSRQTDNTHIMCKIFTAELSTYSRFLRRTQNLFFELYVSERVSQLITRGRKIVVILGRSEFHGFKIHLGRCTANDKSNMVRRTSCRPECFHFLHQKIHQFIGRNQRLCLLIKICLIGRPASLSNKKELILHTVDSVKIDLCRQIATRIHLTVHIEGCILRVTEIFLGIGLIYAQRKCLFITSAGPYLLTFLTHDDGCSCILTKRKLTLASYFGIPQHGKGYILVVIARLRVVQYAGDHLIMLATQ